MQFFAPLTFTAMVHLFTWSVSDGLSIAAFNVQTFGRTKSRNSEVMSIIVKIIERYDIILIQEIIDTTNTTINNLMNALNQPGDSIKYNYEISERLGPSTTKEQYGFFIRADSGLTVVDKYQYPDVNRTFERPPFSIRLNSSKSEIKDFMLTAIHAKPAAAVGEIGNLTNVHSELQFKWNTDNILILGDLNAGCKYASVTALNRLEIRKDPPFAWLIPDDADTTTRSNCPYDRFIMTGAQFKDSLVVNSPRVFRFDDEYNLTLNQTTAVSDHYPIELHLLNSTSSTTPLLVSTTTTTKNKAMTLSSTSQQTTVPVSLSSSPVHTSTDILVLIGINIGAINICLYSHI